MPRIGTEIPLTGSTMEPFSLMSPLFSRGAKWDSTGCPVSGLIGYGTYGINGSDEFVASPFGLSVVSIRRDETGSYATLPAEETS